MLKRDLLLKNPLSEFGFTTDDIISDAGFGAVLARAGVGKTAFLVQLALNSMLRGANVLHVSMYDPVDKVALWYKELFQRLAQQYQVEQITKLWESILPHRFIMTFMIDDFNVPKFKERLTDLTEQNIFHPHVIFVDGLHFDESVREHLIDLKDLAIQHSFHIWFSVHIHRHQEPGPDGTPIPLMHTYDLFDVALKLQPEDTEVHIEMLKGRAPSLKKGPIIMDSSTMLIKE